jgi:hypothetical protein
MKIVEGKQKDYEAQKALNSGDPYGSRIFSYAEGWAKLLENEFAVGKKLEDVAEQTSRVADTDGITGFMYGTAVSILGSFWVHGDQLRRWSNLKIQIGNEGEKANAAGQTLNPALLIFSDGKEN